MAKQKNIPELQAEIADNERQLAQLQHKKQRLENRAAYHEKGDRRKRTHHLFTLGAAIESVSPLTKVLTETEFYAFTEKSLPSWRLGACLWKRSISKPGKTKREVLSIALYHFHVKQIKRSAVQSAIASAAYFAGRFFVQGIARHPNRLGQAAPVALGTFDGMSHSVANPRMANTISFRPRLLKNFYFNL